MLKKITAVIVCLLFISSVSYAGSKRPVDTAIVVTVGPCIDDTDMKTREEALTYDQAGMEIDLVECPADGSACTNTAVTLTTGGVNDWTHLDQGRYQIEITAAQNNTEGDLQVLGYCTGVLPFESPVYEVVPTMVNNSLVAGTDKLETDMTQWEGNEGVDAEAQSEAADALTAFWTTPATLVTLIWAGSTAPTATAIVDEWESQSQTDPTGFHVNVKEINATAQTAGDVTALANSSAAWGYINSGIVFRGLVTADDPGVSFTCSGLAGQGVGMFVDSGTPWYAYVARDAGGAGAAPQGEAQQVLTYTSATGLFTTNAYTTPVATGDDVIIMSYRIAATADVKAVVDDILLDTAEIGAAGAGLTNIDLPNQTMNITGDITGNLSGSVGSINGGLVSVIPCLPYAVAISDTATVRLSLAIINPIDDLPTTGEITPGTITIDRRAPGATSWTNVVNAAACTEAAGLVYYEEAFDTSTGYRAGDQIRITFKSIKVVVGGNDMEITGTDGLMYEIPIRSF